MLTVFAVGELDLGLESNLLRNLLQLGSFGLLAIGVIWLLYRGAPMLQKAMADMSTSHAVTTERQTEKHEQIVANVSADNKATLERISSDNKAALEKLSADHKLAMEKISADCKAAIDKVVSESKAAIERKNDECQREREEYRAMMERERELAAKEREEYRKSDKDLREILQTAVNKIEAVTRPYDPKVHQDRRGRGNQKPQS